MTNWQFLYVPYAECHIVRRMGAEWSKRDRSWICNTRQYKSKPFRRWHSKQTWRKVVIHLASGSAERTEAKANRCCWDPDTKSWYVQVTTLVHF